jgi:two-component system sensor kinase FixL
MAGTAAGPKPLDLAAVFASLPHAYLVIGPDLTALAASDEYLRLTLTCRQDLIGTQVFGDPRSDRLNLNHVRSAIAEAFRTGRPSRLRAQKFDIAGPDARGGGFEERCWDIVDTPVLDAAGQVVCVIHSCADVGDAVRREQAAAEHLGEIEERFAVTFEQSAVGVAHVGLGGRLRRTNARFRALLGYAPEEIADKRMGELIHPEDRALADRHVAELLSGSVPHYRTEKRYLRKDGAPLWVSVTRSLVRTAGGEPDYFVVVVEEIAARKEAEAALQEREASLQSILDTVPDGLVVIDDRGTVELFSKAAEKVFGYRAAEVIGRNVKMLMPAGERERHDGYLARYLETGVPTIIGIGRIVTGERKDGSTFPMTLSVGEVAGKARFVGFVRDITERQQTEANLRELQAELVHMSRFTALGEMASALAHELNQPLTAIANYLKGGRRLLEQNNPAMRPVLLEAVNHAAEQALRAGQIIRRLRDFVARGESERRPESLPRMIDEACALALVGAGNSGIRVLVDLDPEARLIYADRIQIQQVLVNLIRNAVEAMSDATTRRLTIGAVAMSDHQVEVSVADTGPGLSPEVAAHLFQPFVTTKKTGMGVGLSICRTIVEAHEGTIWAGVPAGGGTVFRFTLPSVTAEADADGA